MVPASLRHRVFGGLSIQNGERNGGNVMNDGGRGCGEGGTRSRRQRRGVTEGLNRGDGTCGLSFARRAEGYSCGRYPASLGG